MQQTHDDQGHGGQETSPVPQVAKPPRNTDVDMIRFMALIGICVVNMPFLGLTPMQHEILPTGADLYAKIASNWLLQSKFFVLFSFIFGWGIGVQMASAARTGASFEARYLRRMIGLAVLGLAHALLVFTGDILFLYAIVGTLAFLMRGLPANTLMRRARLFVVVSVFSIFGLGALIAMDLASLTEADLGGSFAAATASRIETYPSTLVFLMLFQGPMALAAMLAGLAAQKSGFLKRGSAGRARLAKLAPWLFIAGLPMAMLFPHDDADESLTALVGILLMPFSAAMMSAAYLNAFLWLSARFSLPAIFVSAGQNSLTAYILQGVIAGFVFGGYGLGLYGQIGNLGLLGLSLVIALLAMVLTHLLRFGGPRAPFEHLLRRITYLRA